MSQEDGGGVSVEVRAGVSASLRTGRGRIDVEAAPRRLERLRDCLADAACRQLALVVCIAQLCDAAITNVALRRGFVEENRLMRELVFNPLLGGAVKVAAVLCVCGLAAMRLPVRQARIALRVAAALSMLGPAIDALQLLHR